MRLAWLTDLHLNFVPPKRLAAFVEAVTAEKPDAVLLGGDIGEAHSTAGLLERLAASWQVPIYFVLGNHDFYHGSIAAVRAEVLRLAERVPNLVYLSVAAPVALTGSTTLLGADGWGDGGFGNAGSSTIALNDFRLIGELRSTPDLLATVRQLGEESSAHLRAGLAAALETSERLIVLTHVPPFREATWHEGRISGDDWLPWFACRATGKVLRKAIERHPDKEMLVLCGHTHGAGEATIMPNLRVSTGGAEYGGPVVQQLLKAE